MLVRGGLRYTVLVLTAIDLATFECSDAIDIALRVRAATLAGMYEALQMTPHRAGNLEKLKLLIDSRNEPWSAAERLSHRLLRAKGITGWETNLPVCIDGQMYYLDIAFGGRSWHRDRRPRRETDEDLFESDRWRQKAWWPTVASFTSTWAMLRDHPDVFISTVLDALH